MYTRPQTNIEHIPGKLVFMVSLSSGLTMLTALAISGVLIEHSASQTPPQVSEISNIGKFAF